ncbi:hypothetical protein QZH41_012783 [Actinostola sp. cb2023]|nr:hypothetical protein QZH41_012783 [Actinostola sp. cb2023]
MFWRQNNNNRYISRSKATFYILSVILFVDHEMERILSNYTIEIGSQVYRDDLLAHVLEEKENIGDLDLKNNAVSQLTFKALKQVFGEVKECRLGPRNNRRRAYLNLKRKDIVQRRGRVHFENEWQILRSGIDALAKEAGDWQVIENKQLNYLSCIHCENVRYDGARVLTEIMLTKNMENKKIDVSLMYDRRSVSKESMTNLLGFEIHKLEALEKAKTIMSLVMKASVCFGFLLEDEFEEDLNISATGVIRTLSTSEGEVERRGFSGQCEVFTNVSGKNLFQLCEGEKIAKKKGRT